MDIIIGLGSAGCAIADGFSEYPQYDVYKIDAGLQKAKNSYALPTGLDHQGYENAVPKNFSSFVKKVPKEGGILFVVCGSSFVSGASLRILENFKNRSVSILYIKPDAEMIGGERQLQERLVYRVLQEYARSGLFKEMMLVHNSTIEKMLGGVSIRNYHQKINETIISTIHMMNVFENSDPVLAQDTPSSDVSRISTLGIMDCEKNEESFFFPLDKVTEMRYYYGMNEDALESDSKALGNIRESVRIKKGEGLSQVGYSIHTTQYDRTIGYCVARSSQIQTFPEKSEKSS